VRWLFTSPWPGLSDDPRLDVVVLESIPLIDGDKWNLNVSQALTQYGASIAVFTNPWQPHPTRPSLGHVGFVKPHVLAAQRRRGSALLCGPFDDTVARPKCVCAPGDFHGMLLRDSPQKHRHTAWAHDVDAVIALALRLTTGRPL
jgi:hypothetical protein